MTLTSLLPCSAGTTAFSWDRIGEQTIRTVLIVLGAFAVILAGRFILGRALSAVTGTVGLTRMLNGRSSAAGSAESSRRARRTKTAASLLTNALAVIVSVVSFLMILDVWGFPAAPLLTSVGIVGIAVGFGFQQIFRDYLAGFFITVEDQFGIGDLIETSEVKGRVRAMSLRITTVEAEDGAIWYLRNGEILRVANHSQGLTTTSLPITRSEEDGAAPQTAPTTEIRRIPEDAAAESRPQTSHAASADDPSTAKKPLAQKETE